MKTSTKRRDQHLKVTPWFSLTAQAQAQATYTDAVTCWFVVNKRHRWSTRYSCVCVCSSRLCLRHWWKPGLTNPFFIGYIYQTTMNNNIIFNNTDTCITISSSVSFWTPEMGGEKIHIDVWKRYKTPVDVLTSHQMVQFIRWMSCVKLRTSENVSPRPPLKHFAIGFHWPRTVI